MNMFCYQCEQTSQCTGCTSFGVCGKDPETASLQDLLVQLCKKISEKALAKRQAGEATRKADLFVTEGLFTTVTNVNFDAKDIAGIITRGAALLKEFGGDWELPSDLDGLISAGELVGIESRMNTLGEDVTGLQELILYGLKGTAAYADHALVLGKEDDSVFAFFHEAMAFLLNPAPNVDELVALALKRAKST